jgi:hypothetical protein
MQTLLLDTVANDLVLDVNNNIAIASNPYSLAQDAASAVKTFQGECYFDVTLGIPYFAVILGKTPSLPILKALFDAAALQVPGVVSSQTAITAIVNRAVSGQVQVSSSIGQPAVAGFTTTNPQGVG